MTLTRTRIGLITSPDQAAGCLTTLLDTHLERQFFACGSEDLLLGMVTYPGSGPCQTRLHGDGPGLMFRFGTDSLCGSVSLLPPEGVPISAPAGDESERRLSHYIVCRGLFPGYHLFATDGDTTAQVEEKSGVAVLDVGRLLFPLAMLVVSGGEWPYHPQIDCLTGEDLPDMGGGDEYLYTVRSNLCTVSGLGTMGAG